MRRSFESLLLPIPVLTPSDLLRFLKKIKKIELCWIWQAYKSDGYGRFTLKGKEIPAHRISYSHFKGPPELFRVCHTCNNRACVNPEHLYLGTQSENIQQCWLQGRHNVDGELNPHAKLRETDVKVIRKLHEEGVKAADIARKFSWVDASTIYKVISRDLWKTI